MLHITAEVVTFSLLHKSLAPGSHTISSSLKSYGTWPQWEEVKKRDLKTSNSVIFGGAHGL